MTIRISTDAKFKRLKKKFATAPEAEMAAFLDAVGDTVANGAKRRIMEAKTAPGGKKWDPWSKRYAKTRHGGHSLLRDTGALVDSITHEVSTMERSVVVGSNLVYAATHQFGDPDRKIPARPYLDAELEDPWERREVRSLSVAFVKGLFK